MAMAMARKIMSMNINWKLPDEIVKVIFSKLPFSNLPNCRIVCKAWNDLVLDYANNSSSKLLHPPNALILCAYDFGWSCWNRRRCDKMHCIDFDSTTTTTRSVATLWLDRHRNHVDILSSCNGLLQIHREDVNFCCDVIWNPMTNEFFKLPKIKGVYDDYEFGFGFSPKTNKYKLFRILEIEDYIVGPVSRIEVLRFGIRNGLQWRAVGCQPFSIHDRGTYLNGVVYWIGNDITNKFVIYGLDVETETFETIHILDVGPCSTETFTQIHPFNDTICAIIEMFEPIWERQVWIMRAKHFWIRELVIHIPKDEKYKSFCFIKAFENEGRIFFVVNNDLFCFDKTGKMIHTLSYSNVTEIATVVCIDSFHFGYLSKILAETVIKFL